MNKHIVTNEESGATPFHTHGFAKVASGDRLGAVSPTSFEERIKLENSRKLVGGYQRSTLGSTYNPTRPRVARPNSTRPGGNSRTAAPGRGVGIPKRSFREPPTRGYNPYA
ncbi:MAG TPA: hypothetical protein PLZ58_00010 [Candidatus Saccharibacteria bacterium]|nr:hypothetical protein [Candidatus Saccharibacteria bacterium]HRQ07292.1 hypothetical protein [Candidatus Saccharibacteria bacterium]